MAAKFVDTIPVNDLPMNRTMIVTAGEKRVLLANDNGEILAVSPYCTHDGGDLDGTEVIDHEVTCHRHGARFDLRTGDPTRMPAVFGLRSFETKVENGMIKVAV